MGNTRIRGLTSLLIVVVLGLLLPACISIEKEAKSSIQENALLALMEGSLQSLTQVDLELDAVSKDLKAANLKLGKLEQVGIPAQQWTDNMKVQAEKEQLSPRRLNVTTELKNLKNDTYEVVKLQFSVDSWTGGRGRFSSVINIYEVSTAKEYAYSSFRDDLKAKVDSLKLILKSRTDNMLLAVATVKKVTPQVSTWKAVKVDATTYSIRGQGLGIVTGPAVGEWTYYTANGKITPADAPAMSLNKVLSGQGA